MDDFVCLSCGLASKSIAMVISGRCLHLIGLVPKIRTLRAANITAKLRHNMAYIN